MPATSTQSMAFASSTAAPAGAVAPTCRSSGWSYEAIAKRKQRRRRSGGEHGEGEPHGFPAGRLADETAQEQRATHAERGDQRPAALIGAAPARRREPRHGRRHA